MQLSTNTVTTFHPLHPEITKANIMRQFPRSGVQLPSLDELRATELNKGGIGSGRKTGGGKLPPKLKPFHSIIKNSDHHRLNENGSVTFGHEDASSHHTVGASSKENRFYLQTHSGNYKTPSNSGNSTWNHSNDHGYSLEEHEVKQKLARYGISEKGRSIKKSEEDTLEKAEINTKTRKKLAHEGEARKDGSFPIRNAKDVENAVHDVGRANNPSGAKKWIKQRAKDLGVTNELPEKWHKAEDEDEEEKGSTGDGPGIEGGIKKAEGSKGGKVIGHTKSGKPIYDTFSHPAHASFSKLDHAKAAAIHDQMSLGRAITRKDSDKKIHHELQSGKHMKAAKEAAYDEHDAHKNKKVEKAFNNIMSKVEDPIEKAFANILGGQ